MRTYDDLIKELGPLANVEQGSAEWKMMRLGAATSSPAKAFMAGRNTETYWSYVVSKVSEIIKLEPAEEISARSLRWGKDNEPAARMAYSFENDKSILDIPFIYKDESRWFGCSPDGLIQGESRGLELKCPDNTDHFVNFAFRDKYKTEHSYQCQFSMWVTGYDFWDYANYDPRVKIFKNLHSITFERDESMMRQFDARAEEWMKDLGGMLERAELKYGIQFEALNG